MNGMLFNIYYLNFSKTYEIKMIISNILQLTSTTEKNKNEGIEADLKASIGATFLSLFKADVSSGIKSASSDTQKVIETFEVKSTKSIILKNVIDRCKTVDLSEKCVEGQLIKIDNVSLRLTNETELRSVKMFSSGAFKDSSFLQVEGIDLNNVLNSIFKDYSYKIAGTIAKNERILVKIPMTVENEFENMYNIDDLFIGKMSLIGIYKGEIEFENLKNSFDFFQEFGNQNSDNYTPEVLDSQTSAGIINKTNANQNSINSCANTGKYHYIDLLAIVQNIQPLENEKITEVKNEE